MSPADLDDTLRQLPMPRAPLTLLPRVLAAVDAWSRRPWYVRAWFTWPLGWQVVTVSALMLLAGAGALLLPTAWAAVDDVVLTFAGGAIDDVAGMVQGAQLTANALRIAWRALFQPLMTYASLLVVLMCLACGLFGAALNRAAFGRAL